MFIIDTIIRTVGVLFAMVGALIMVMGFFKLFSSIVTGIVLLLVGYLLWRLGMSMFKGYEDEEEDEEATPWPEDKEEEATPWPEDGESKEEQQ